MYRTWLIWLLLVNLNEGFQFLNQNLRLENRKDLEFSENVLTLDIAYTLCSQDCICEAKQKSVFCYKIDLKTFPHLPVNNEIIVIQNSELLFLKSGMFQDVANVTTLQITRWVECLLYFYVCVLHRLYTISAQTLQQLRDKCLFISKN